MHQVPGVDVAVGLELTLLSGWEDSLGRTELGLLRL